jgi:hypothetical protein
MIIRDRETLSLLVNLAIASAKLRKIIIQQDFGVHEMRPQIHLIISGDPGSNKSTVLSEVARQFKSHPYMELTNAGLLGSIDKNTKSVTPGAAWLSRNACLVGDEFEFVDPYGRINPITNMLLSLTEHDQYFKKKIGLASDDFNKKDKDLFFRVKNGTIEVKTNFSLIIGTMNKMTWKNQKLIALKSRCIPLRWLPEFDIISEIAKGKKIFRYSNLLATTFKENQGLIQIDNSDYNKIFDFLVTKNIENYLFLRTLGDLCRVFAITKKHDFNTYNLIINLKTEI